MTARRGIRKRIWETGADPSPRDIAEAMRDVDQHIQGTIPRKIVELTTQYAPPAPFTLSYDHVPSGITCIRVRAAKSASNATFNNSGGACSFDWSGNSIRVYLVGDLLTPGLYTFTLEIIG